MSLRSKLLLRSVIGLIMVAAILFVPAGSLRFWQAWAFLALVFVPGISSSFYLYKHDPKLVERRLETKEKVREQRLLVTLLRPLFLAAFLLPGLDYRFGWSRTIQVEPGQTVVTTGPYRVVRHPMYLGSLVMLLSIPLALGSYFAWPAFALLIPFYVLRLLNEEKVLRQQLPGYSEYCLRTRFRLLPFVW